MKTIGLIGGMSWESTVTYYQVINETIKQKLGGFHSAKILMYSVDFDEIETNMTSGNWTKNATILSDAAKRLETAGTDFILICTNTLHKVAPEVRKQLSVPILHIAEVTAQELKKAGIDSTGLLGTRFTMTEKFYTDVLEQNGIRVLIPEEEDAQITDRIIFDELCIGDIRDTSRKSSLVSWNVSGRKAHRVSCWAVQSWDFWFHLKIQIFLCSTRLSSMPKRRLWHL